MLGVGRRGGVSSANPHQERAAVDLAFYIDPATHLPHIYRHGVDEVEVEVEDVLLNPGEDRVGREGTRIAIGQTSNGRYLRVVYVQEDTEDRLFVITAYELKGKPLAAFRRRRRRKR